MITSEHPFNAGPVSIVLNNPAKSRIQAEIFEADSAGLFILWTSPDPAIAPKRLFYTWHSIISIEASVNPPKE